MKNQKHNFLDISQIDQNRLDQQQYFREKHPKKQIVLHHTVSGAEAKGVVRYWNKNAERVGTAFIIDGHGTIHQCFSSAHWAHHLGTRLHNNRKLNQQSIGVEICSWGGLKYRKGKYWTVYKTEVPRDQVVDYGIEWRGFRYFHRYNEAQLSALKTLLLYLCDKYEIPKTYNSDIWKYSLRAISGSAGIFSHVSFRKDKSDCHPQLELQKMLAGLGNGDNKCDSMIQIK